MSVSWNAPRRPHQSLAERRSGLVAVRSGVARLFTLITYLLAIAALSLLVGSAIHHGRVVWNDLHYGRPRTTHLSGVVGHNDANGVPTHFVAINLQRQVVVLELPGGDATQVRSFPAPYLFGDNEELTPVFMDLRDVDRDGFLDLVISVRNEQIFYLNKDGTFRLPGPAEQARLVREQQGP
jgi:hypothetical protein